MGGWMDDCPHGSCCGMKPPLQALAPPLTGNSELGLLHQLPHHGRELSTVDESGILSLKCMRQAILRHCDVIFFIPLQLLPIELPHKAGHFLGEADLKHSCLVLSDLHRLLLSLELQRLMCSRVGEAAMELEAWSLLRGGMVMGAWRLRYHRPPVAHGCRKHPFHSAREP